MCDTKEQILLTALRLFARDGYEAVSVRAIAEAMGMTKGALYRHYRNKRDIFDSILRRMEALDAARAREYGVPEGTMEEMAQAYRSTGADSIVAYAKAQFRYWTCDVFSAAFRRLLTLEQFRSEEMGRLYQQYLCAGPLGYMTDLFSGSAQAAAGFYAPMFLLYSVYDGAQDKDAVLALMDGILDGARDQIKSITGEEKQS